MTDRVRTLIVTLNQDFRDDDVQAVVQAIEMVRGVASVDLGGVVQAEDHYARQAVAHEIGDGLIAVARALYAGRGFKITADE